MLTDEQKYQNKIKYISLLSRLGVDLTQFIKYLEDIDYFNQPASQQYRFAYSGGLCEQALKECHELGVLCTAYFPDNYTEEDIIKVALLRNIYKAEMYEVYSRNVKNEATGQWESIMAYRTKDNRISYGDVGFSSFMIASKFFQFSDEQIEAIVHSSKANNAVVDVYQVMKKFPLIVLTKMADMAVNNFNL